MNRYTGRCVATMPDGASQAIGLEVKADSVEDAQDKIIAYQTSARMQYRLPGATFGEWEITTSLMESSQP